MDRRHRGGARRARSTRRPRSSWEHDNGIRGVWDITLAPDLYLRSDYYTNDERWEVTGPQGLRARQPLHRPRHPAAEPRGLRRRRDARVPRARRRLGEQLPRLRPALAALAAHRRGSAVVERRRSRRRPALRARGLREQRSAAGSASTRRRCAERFGATVVNLVLGAARLRFRVLTDWGNGSPIVLSHGWPLNADSWEAQMLVLASNGFRCIATRPATAVRPRLGSATN